MDDRSYTAGFTVERSPAEVFAAVNDVRAWWMTETDGSTAHVGDEFGYEVPDVHRVRMRVARLELGRLVEWQVIENFMSFISDQTEWVGTTIRFEISEADGGTRLHFTHEGLVPEYECFDVCRNAWDRYIQSLRELIATGTGSPASAEEARAA